MTAAIVNLPRDTTFLVLGASLPLGALLAIDAIKHLMRVGPVWMSGRSARSRTGSASSDHWRKLATLAWMQAVAAVLQLVNQIIFVVINTMPASATNLSCAAVMATASFTFILFQTLALLVVIIRATGILPMAVVSEASGCWTVWRRPRRIARAVLMTLLGVALGLILHSSVTKNVTVHPATGLCVTVYPWNNNVGKLVLVVLPC
ncbi:hypothetical protein GGF32_001833 [Allomyces javanicus]|nr:hypothetical protein GGF32_001833 [Allomyces javanicus]